MGIKKKILIIGTGGTIASRPGEQGFAPEVTASELMEYVPKAKGLCATDQISLMNLDSTNVAPAHWLEIARCIRDAYDRYDGFLVLHGTDTMAYTAAALSYLLQNSRKPIVLTGSQIPMEEEGTDAKNNILQSLLYAVSPDASDVTIVFGGKVIAGTRARKMSVHALDGFSGVDCPDRAIIRGEQVEVQWEHHLTEPFACYDKLEPRVIDLKLVPGMQPDSLLCLADYYEGFVLEGFGIGGLPDMKNCDYFPFIRELTRRGKTVAVTTQVPSGGCDMSVYEVGRRFLDELPILEGGTMTPEAIAVKLMWILSQTRQPDKIRELFHNTINHDRLTE